MSLKVWLPLNGTLDNLGLTNYTISAFRGSIVYDNNGKIGKCFNANGVNTLKILNIIPDFYNYSAYSLCVWCQVTAQNTAHTGSGIISAGNWNNQLLNLAMSNWSTDHYTRLRISGTNWNRTYTYNFNLNTWYHIVVCCDGIKTYAYVNGTNIGNTADSFLPTSIEGNDMCIGGATYYAGMQFFGKINDVRIYDHCLSAAEVKEIAQGLILHYKLDDITNGIQDSSGYGNNGTINSMPAISSETVRYSASTSFDGVDDCIIVPYNTICPENIFTFNLWFKKDALGSKNYETLFGGPSGFEMDTRAGSATTLSLYMASVRSTKRNLVTELSLGNWYMVTMTRDGTKEKYYINGIYQSEIDAKTMPTGTYRIGAWNSNTGQNYYGLISDFRIYCTALSADDILTLYHTGAKVDNLGNLHTYEFNENGSNKLTKTGILEDYVIEPYKTLSDGSCWKLMLFHYVDGGNNLFTSSNATYNNGFGLYSRLRDIANYTYNNQYEYYVIQDGTEFRWTQTSSPTAASITGLTTVSGYNNPVNGLAKSSSLTQTYIGYNSWWGACGCWTSYTTGGKTGIPGFGTHNAAGICTNYLALYVRIDKSKAQLISGTALGENLIEF